VDIPAHGSQSFVIGFTPTAAFPPTEVRLSFDCANSATPAPRDVGLNTVLLSASDDPVPDVVALAATLAGDGVARLGLTSGDGVFAVATVNLGASAEITATVDVGGLPVQARICRTEPATGECVGGPPTAAPLAVAMPSGSAASFGIFLHADVLVALDARRNRATVRFSDAQGVVRGATGVAVHTEIVPPVAAATAGH
jgi:hypothetical protein